ncbi:aldolase catalytic domain-containing protein [Altericroceibacterium xinjiangense]|uniref:aldolase catalytic domain-containing protein n=1 Tax=Altericroceibacterium xinjiangense TaxID=762261 RepID=UPI0019CFCF20|nr:aldolase catalytic domain-containing protein [Altericroceibacterium xinjiangense]
MSDTGGAVTEVQILDCTLRDGGYYNDWDFEPELVRDYLASMEAARVNVVELGQRFIGNSGFKGPHAFTTDEFLRSLEVPERLMIAVMVNGADLLRYGSVDDALAKLFPEPSQSSPVDVVRIACHFGEMAGALPAAQWLKDRGFRVGFNLMQIADRSHEEVVEVARLASSYPVDVLYFADTMGSMTPRQTSKIIGWLKQGWNGPIGIHTHDNMGLALQNTLRAMADGATWLDATVTGMGRGPGNARTEELVIALEGQDGRDPNLVPLLSVIGQHFQPMKNRYGWGTNPFYFLSGKYGIHPTYIQEMVSDPRYDEEDILAVLDYLRQEGGKRFSTGSLTAARAFYRGEPCGSWWPRDAMAGRDVLLIGTGPGALRHSHAIESYIARHRPVVMALNLPTPIAQDAIDYRVACHPVRLLADAGAHRLRPQPLITPASLLPATLQKAFEGKDVRDFGIAIADGRFDFADSFCILPAPLVALYALSIAASGGARRILVAGFDGYGQGDERTREMTNYLELFQAHERAPELIAVTPTAYGLKTQAVYGL